MTHPFIAAVQAAYDAHGLPPDVASVHISAPTTWRPEPYFGVTMKHRSDCHGFGKALAGAYAHAQDVVARLDAARRDDEAKEAARKLLADAGLSPDLVRE